MLFPTALAVLSTLSYVAAHGYLSSPPPRGIQKAGYQIDDLKSPNTKGLCRGEPEGQVTTVTPGQVLKLGFTITAPHVGPCRVTLLDVDLTNESKPFASKQNCAAPGGPGFWDVTLPSDVQGRKVLRWYWEGQHISTPGEPYEQCIDLDFGGGSGGDNYQPPPPSRKKKPVKNFQAPASKPKLAPRPTPRSAPPPPPPSYGQDDESGDDGYGDEAPATTPYQAPANNNARAPATTDEYSGDGGSCQNGAYKCVGSSKYAVCNWGKWVNMACGTGTVCTPTGNSIVCGYA
jgi:hypothetical protein